MRGFEKISYEQFKKDIKDDIDLYTKYQLPKRSTNHSAGYDFFAIEDFILKPGEIKTIPTGIKVYMQENEMLFLLVRSSVGFKYNVRLCNQVGLIESDYYNNKSNEGHMLVRLQNHGESDFVVNQNERFIQGVFANFLTVSNEEKINNERIGGFGSTNQGGKNE